MKLKICAWMVVNTVQSLYNTPPYNTNFFIRSQLIWIYTRFKRGYKIWKSEAKLKQKHSQKCVFCAFFFFKISKLALPGLMLSETSLPVFRHNES